MIIEERVSKKTAYLEWYLSEASDKDISSDKHPAIHWCVWTGLEDAWNILCDILQHFSDCNLASKLQFNCWPPFSMCVAIVAICWC